MGTVDFQEARALGDRHVHAMGEAPTKDVDGITYHDCYASCLTVSRPKLAFRNSRFLLEHLLRVWISFLQDGNTG